MLSTENRMVNRCQLTISSFLLLVLVPAFFLQTKSMTAATMTTRPPIATNGMTVNGTSLLSAIPEEFVIVFSVDTFSSTVGASSGIFGGCFVVVVTVSGTSLTSSLYTSVALVVLCVIPGKLGGSWFVPKFGNFGKKGG